MQSMDLGPGIKQTRMGSKWPNTKSWNLNSIKERAANSSSKGEGRREESLLLYKSSMLWCSGIKHHCWQAKSFQLDLMRHRTQGGVVTEMPSDVFQKNLLPKPRPNIDLYPETWSNTPSNILNFKGLGFVLGGFLPSSQMFQRFVCIWLLATSQTLDFGLQ